MIETPRSGASEEDVEEDEAIEDRCGAAVDQREEVPRRMRREISDSHVPGQDEGDGPCEQSDADQCAADQLSTDLQYWTLFDIKNWTPGLNVASRLRRSGLSR